VAKLLSATSMNVDPPAVKRIVYEKLVIQSTLMLSDNINENNQLLVELASRFTDGYV